MSLVCHNCGGDMGPSESFPGREGTMVYPNVLFIVWVAEESDKKWVIHYTQPPMGISLCFRCISAKLPDNRQSVLNAVYAAYEAEIKYRRNEEFEKGKMLSGKDLFRGGRLLDEWEAKFKVIPDKECILCGTNLPDNQNPYFTAKVIDRVYCEKSLSWFSQNYSWSDLETGLTTFNCCFGCLKENLPRLFEELSYMLRGVRKSNIGDVTKSELLLTPDVVEALKKEVGVERAQELIQKASETAEVKIVINPEDNISKN